MSRGVAHTTTPTEQVALFIQLWQAGVMIIVDGPTPPAATSGHPQRRTED
jgi:hypothetical protein